MKLFFLAFLLCSGMLSQAQVGIGTTTPSPNSALDVTSTNKGIMLPRLADTTNVESPSAGLMIYDIESGAPTFHDGVKWNTVARSSSMPPSTDSITYTIINPARMGLGFVAGTFPAIHASFGAGAQQGEFGVLSFAKSMDQNTIPFKKAIASETILTGMTIEIKAYVPGESDPYYSIKMTGIEVLALTSSIPAGTLMVNENMTFSYATIGFKNWVTNQSFGWSNVTEAFIAY